jgi:hypothetical protein
MRDHDTRPVWPFKQHGKLTATRRGQWVKKIDRKVHTFGAWSIPDPGDEKAKAALARYLQFMRTRDEELDQSQPEVLTPNDLTLSLAVNGYLTRRKEAVDRNELSPAQFVEYRNVGELILDKLGRATLVRDLTPAHFAKLRDALPGGPVRICSQKYAAKKSPLSRPGQGFTL